MLFSVRLQHESAIGKFFTSALPGKSIEKRDHISNCAEVLLHFIVICWVVTVCQIVRTSLWSDCFILIFTGENVKQVHLNVVRIQLDKRRILLLLRSVNTETCYQRVSEIFFLGICLKTEETVFCLRWHRCPRLWFSPVVPESDSVRTAWIEFFRKQPTEI